MPQYKYQCHMEDHNLTNQLLGWLMDGMLSLTTPAHILAASPSIHKELADKLKNRRVEAHSLEEACPQSNTHPTLSDPPPAALRCCTAEFSLPLWEVNILVNGTILEAGLLDTGSQIVIIREDLALEAQATINKVHRLQMEAASGTISWTLGCAENLPLTVGSISCLVHAHVVKRAPFRLLLGRLFHHLLLCHLEEHANGRVDVSLSDPASPDHHVLVLSRPRHSQVGYLGTFTTFVDPLPPYIDHVHPLSASSDTLSLLCFATSPVPVLAYKKVTNKVCPVPASLPKDFRTVWHIPIDLLLSLPSLPTSPPDFEPSS
jgi:hypothetical protein